MSETGDVVLGQNVILNINVLFLFADMQVKRFILFFSKTLSWMRPKHCYSD